MKKLLFIFIFISIILVPIQVNGEEKSDSNKTVQISIFDENGKALDLTEVMVSLHSEKSSRVTLGYYISTNKHVTGKFTKDEILLEFSTIDDYDIMICLNNGCNVRIQDQLMLSTFDDETELSYNVSDLTKVEIELEIEGYKDIDVLYQIKGQGVFSGENGYKRYTNKPNSSNHIYIPAGKYDVIYYANIDNKSIVYKQEINFEYDGNYKSDISLDDFDKIICSFSDYYMDYDSVIITNNEIHTRVPLKNGDIEIYFNEGIGDMSVEFQSLKSYGYDPTLIKPNKPCISIKLAKERIDLEKPFKINIRLAEYNAKKYIYPKVVDINGNILNIARNEDNVNDIKYEVFDNNDTKIKNGVFGHGSDNTFDLGLKEGKYELKLSLLPMYFGVDAESRFVYEIISEDEWHITDEAGNKIIYLDKGNRLSTETTQVNPPEFGGEHKVEELPQEELQLLELPKAGDRPIITDFNLVDINEDDWFYNDVSYLGERGIINGYGDGSFKPNSNVNVDAFIKMLVTSLGFELENGETYWATPYIDKAIGLGILLANDFDDYTRPITRGEMSVLAANTLRRIEMITPYNQYQFQISDYQDIPNEQQVSTLIATAKGIITGYSDYSFRSKEKATRAQAATIITRIINENNRKYIDMFSVLEDELEGEKRNFQKREKECYAILDDLFDLFIGEDILFENEEQIEPLMNRIEAEAEQFMQEAETIMGISIDEATQNEITKASGDDTWTLVSVDGSKVIKKEMTNGEAMQFELYEEFMRFIIIQKDTSSYEFVKNSVKDYLYLANHDKIQKLDTGVTLLSYVNNDGIREAAIVDNRDEMFSNMRIAYIDKAVMYNNEEKATELYFIDDNNYGMRKYIDDEGNGYTYRLFEDGSTYVGELTEYSRGGNACMSYLGNKYIGYFDDDMLQGLGILIYDKGLIFEDTFTNGQPEWKASMYAMPDESIYAFNKLLDEIIGEVITDDMSEDEKIKALHNYLVLNITYAKDAIEDELIDININNAYSGIVENSTVCLGYAQAFNLLLNRTGIDSYVVVGDTDSDGKDDHAWNYVLFEDGFYHVDVTWDDLDNGKNIRYNYFKVSDEKIKIQRDISMIIGM